MLLIHQCRVLGDNGPTAVGEYHDVISATLRDEILRMRQRIADLEDARANDEEKWFFVGVLSDSRTAEDMAPEDRLAEYEQRLGVIHDLKESRAQQQSHQDNNR